MNTIFIIAATIALISSLMSITNRNAIHALLYLILSLLSISIIFYISGAPFIAALEVIVYAGAIMVLFIFVVMILNIGLAEERENKWLKPRMWVFPVLLAFALLALLVYAMRQLHSVNTAAVIITPKQVGVSLFTTYLIAVEISAVLLMAGIIGAYHLGKQKRKVIHRFLVKQPGVEHTDSNKQA
jgi:NADH-quinone oxidoreductase subunit J